ncbi:MAG TPA: hypothetical protein VGB92_20945, partial [Longimicrobium sp.]
MARTIRPWIFAALAAASLAPAPARAQAPAEGWNGARALELIARARDRRSQALADTGLLDYQADAR